MTFRRFLLPLLISLPLAATPAWAEPADAAPRGEQTTKRVSKGERQALQWFAMLDTDKDGRISREEAAVAIRLSSRLADYFRDADLDGDGYVTQQEIRTVADRRRAERQRRRQLEAEQAQAQAPGEAPTTEVATHGRPGDKAPR